MVANPKYLQVPISKSGYKSFEEFYPFYLGEHANKTCRRLHLVGTTLSTGTAVTALATGNYNLLWAVPLIGYGSAWVGHFFFEHNRPATFKHPLYSLAGDYRMWWEVLSGQRAF